MVLQPYTLVAIVGMMVFATVMVGLVGLAVGAIAKLLGLSSLRLGVYGAYSGAIPGGLIAYTIASALGEQDILAAGAAFMGGGIGSAVGAIAATAGTKLLKGRRRRRPRRKAAAPMATGSDTPTAIDPSEPVSPPSDS